MNAHVMLYCQWRKFKYMTHGFREFCTYNMYEERYQWQDFKGRQAWAFFMWNYGYIGSWR